MKDTCPISQKRVNEKAAQANAALVVIFILIFLLTPYSWILIIPAVDFFIRGFLDPSYSFFSAASNAILRACKIEPVMINAAPKIFAAKMGFTFCCVIALTHFLEFRNTTLILGAIFVLFAGLESIFKFCIACKIYPFINYNH